MMIDGFASQSSLHCHFTYSEKEALKVVFILNAHKSSMKVWKDRFDDQEIERHHVHLAQMQSPP